MLLEILVCLAAGIGAGVGTGFAGISAATVISPLLIVLLDIPAYQAVGIALASDVLASAVSATTYAKSKNIDVKSGSIMLISVLAMTAFGSFIAAHMPNMTMGYFSTIITAGMGINFLIRPNMKTREEMAQKSKRRKLLESLGCGMYIGFVCGFVGAGGGLMMLFVLTTVLGYEQKTAVGTSVFVMSFTAFTGAVSHFYIGGVADYSVLILCIVFTFIAARISAVFANKAKPATLNRITGVILTIIGISMTLIRFVTHLS
jgi:uncharacterized protein